MANTGLAARGRIDFCAPAGRISLTALIQPAIIFLLASLAAIISDLTTPLAPSIGVVGAVEGGVGQQGGGVVTSGGTAAEPSGSARSLTCASSAVDQ